MSTIATLYNVESRKLSWAICLHVNAFLNLCLDLSSIQTNSFQYIWGNMFVMLLCLGRSELHGNHRLLNKPKLVGFALIFKANFIAKVKGTV